MNLLPAAVAFAIDAAARRHGIEPALARAVAWVESRGQHYVSGSSPRLLTTSAAGALGVFQLMPATAESLGVDPADEGQNIEGGVMLLARLLRAFDGEHGRALAAYVWGSGNVNRQPDPTQWPARVHEYIGAVIDRAGLETQEAKRDLPRDGVRSYGFQRSTHLHNGVDLKAAEGTPIFAAAPGVVTHATTEWQQGFSGYGRTVVVQDDHGDFELYAHLSEPAVKPGDRVEHGALLGYAGRTQYARDDHSSMLQGAHLHFEVAPTAYPQKREAPRHDPIAWLERGHVHPIDRLPLKGQTVPGPFVVAVSSEPLPRSLSEAVRSPLPRSLLERWADIEAGLEELTAQVGDSALRERMIRVRDELAAVVDAARSSASGVT